MQDNTSPEERLLRLIRGERKESSPQDKKVANDPKASQLALSGIFKWVKIKEHFSFNQINRMLLGILLILGIYLLIDFLITSPQRIERKVLNTEEVAAAALEIPGKIPSSLKPVSYYSQPVKSKNLFTATSPEIKPARPSLTFLEMVSKLRLQGIVSGANPQAIIEDTRTKQVYFLAPGERIGEIELKQILPGKVRLNYYGQEAELPL